MGAYFCLILLIGRSTNHNLCVTYWINITAKIFVAGVIKRS